MTEQINPMDRIIIEDDAGGEEYALLLADFEQRIAEILEEHNIPRKSISIQYLIDKADEIPSAAAITIQALIMVRMLRTWERESAGKGPETSAMFRRIASASMNIGAWTTAISPLVFDLEGIRDSLLVSRKKGGEARAVQFRDRQDAFEVALKACWERGDRHTQLKAWSDAVTTLSPELNPDKDTSFDKINRLLGKLGRDLYGAEWPIGRNKRS